MRRDGRATRSPLLACCAALALAAAGACGDDGAGITVGDIVDDPERYEGLTATVHGEVETIHAPGLFTLDGSRVIGDEILVHTPELAEVVQDANVRVTGTVRRVVVTEVEQELDLDLDPELEIEYEDRPMIMAAQVEAVEPVE